MASEEIVEKLPKTKDGVPIIPGMTLYHPKYDYRHDDWGSIVGSKTISVNNGIVTLTTDIWLPDDPTECYSTKEEAIKGIKEREQI